MSQVLLLQELLQRDQLEAVEVNTVDRCQGRDWACVIMSLVRSNDRQLVGEILTDWRRLNVALSRAKTKLVVVCDRRTIASIPAWREFVLLCSSRQWIYSLPVNWKEALERDP